MDEKPVGEGADVSKLVGLEPAAQPALQPVTQCPYSSLLFIIFHILNRDKKNNKIRMDGLDDFLVRDCFESFSIFLKNVLRMPNYPEGIPCSVKSPNFPTHAVQAIAHQRIEKQLLGVAAA
jgi:hypothetical protein